MKIAVCVSVLLVVLFRLSAAVTVAVRTTCSACNVHQREGSTIQEVKSLELKVLLVVVAGGTLSVLPGVGEGSPDSVP